MPPPWLDGVAKTDPPPRIRWPASVRKDRRWLGATARQSVLRRPIALQPRVPSPDTTTARIAPARGLADTTILPRPPLRVRPPASSDPRLARPAIPPECAPPHPPDPALAARR